jgi:hypothetical protein
MIVESNREPPTQQGRTVVSWAEMNSTELRDYFTDAIRFWEPRRVVYNLVLAAIVVAYFVAGYPARRACFRWILLWDYFYSQSRRTLHIAQPI